MGRKQIPYFCVAVMRCLNRVKTSREESEISTRLQSLAGYPRLACSSIGPELQVKNSSGLGSDLLNTTTFGLPAFFSSFLNRTLRESLKKPVRSFLNPFSSTGVTDKKQVNFSAEFTDKGMTIEIDMTGFNQEDVNVKVEGPWLVIEGNMTTAVPEKEGGGLMIRHIVRRYEIPPNSDVSNIKMKFNDNRLVVVIPSLTPSIKKE